MPIQHTICGQPVRLQMPPRRFQALIILVVFVTVNFGFYGLPTRESIPTYEEVADAVKHPAAHVPDLGELPSIPVPFGPSAHRPPAQPNSTATSSFRAISWLTDFKWRNPFSSATTFDENRAVLPPLPDRPPIYTYYEPRPKQDKKVTEAENRLILAWRRAWWAQGFRPTVLSHKDAKAHPQYQLFQRLKLDPKIEEEVARWLAWGHMQGGILANWLALPMAQYENPMLAFLRHGEYPKLSKIRGLDNGVFFGSASAIDEVLKKVINHDLFKNTTASMAQIAKASRKEGGIIVNLVSGKDVDTNKEANGIAYYSLTALTNNYKTISDKLTNTTQAEALGLLANLINSHLHLTFQEQHPEGVIIAKPLPQHTSALMTEAIDIGRNLTQCPASPMPKSCPPNRLKCKPCDPNKPLKIQLLPEFINSTKSFTLGTVPHPYTLTSLNYERDELDANFLRNNAKRDVWIRELTRKSIGADHTESFRITQFKELVAAAPAHTLWLTAERIIQADIDWILGFGLPQTASPEAEPSSPSNESELIIFPRPAAPAPIKGQDLPAQDVLETEQKRLEKARDALKSKDRNMKKIVEAVEQWHLADTEAWKFARAFSARRRVERVVWEEEEKKYAGSERKAGLRPGESGGRWLDGR
ncbi:hypothetical protein ACN47E_006636 [Coniothyrium glycines]